VKVTGEAALKAAPEQLWAAFNDPAVLVHTIPGCQRLEQTGEDTYKMTLRAGVAAIKGVYDGRVQLLDKVEPRSLRMVASGSGGPGTIEVSVAVNVEPDGDGARLTYDADATVGGMIGGVSQRMLATVGKRLAAEFFGNLDAHIARGGPEAGDGEAGSPQGGVAGGAAGPDAAGGASASRPGGASAGGAGTSGGQPGTADSAVAGQAVFERPSSSGGAFSSGGASSSGDLVKGAAAGGALVLLGVIAGGLLGRRQR